MKLFKNRQDAGRKLAQHLKNRDDSEETIILALPRGGVPVAYEVAKEMGVPLDVFIVRKLGAPFQEELAMGALASGGVKVLNQRLIHAYSISEKEVDEIIAREEKELDRRENLYRYGKPPLNVKQKIAILIDDGLATGSTMIAAIKALRKLEPKKVIVAVPVSPVDTGGKIQDLADEFHWVSMPEPFYGVGQWYEDFAQTEDEEVLEILSRSEKGNLHISREYSSLSENMERLS